MDAVELSGYDGGGAGSCGVNHAAGKPDRRVPTRTPARQGPPSNEREKWEASQILAVATHHCRKLTLQQLPWTVKMFFLLPDTEYAAA